MKKMRVVVAGLIHDHVWAMLPAFKKLPGVELVGAADPNTPLLAKISKEFGVRAVFKDYRTMFKSVDADAVMICTSNAGAGPVTESAAAHGLDIMVEKPMAATADQAKRMARAVTRHKVRLMVNWPTAWSPALTKAMALVKAGDLGHVFHARVHMSHQGPKEAGCTPYFYGWLYDKKENGGGAIIDYCCYGAAIFATLWGRPRQVIGVAGNLVKKNFPVDDNAIITAIYDKRILVTQASWTQNPDYHESWFLGDRATLETRHGKLIRSHTNPSDYSHWGAEDRTKVREIPLSPMPVGRRNGPEHFIHCLRTGEPFTPVCSMATGVLAQEILSAGVASNRAGKRVRV